MGKLFSNKYLPLVKKEIFVSWSIPFMPPLFFSFSSKLYINARKILLKDRIADVSSIFLFDSC
jgi:hypothetical protein